jgi:hypothetical protein
MKNSNSTFSYSVVTLDDNEYEKCVFNNCTLVYKGGPLPMLRDCQLKDCKWTFEDAALRTFHWMMNLYRIDKGLGEDLFAKIREDK